MISIHLIRCASMLFTIFFGRILCVVSCVSIDGPCQFLAIWEGVEGRLAGQCVGGRGARVGLDGGGQYVVGRQVGSRGERGGLMGILGYGGYWCGGRKDGHLEFGRDSFMRPISTSARCSVGARLPSPDVWVCCGIG